METKVRIVWMLLAWFKGKVIAVSSFQWSVSSNQFSVENGSAKVDLFDCFNVFLGWKCDFVGFSAPFLHFLGLFLKKDQKRAETTKKHKKQYNSIKKEHQAAQKSREIFGVFRRFNGYKNFATEVPTALGIPKRIREKIKNKEG